MCTYEIIESVIVHTEIGVDTSTFKKRSIFALGDTVGLSRIKVGTLGIDMLIPFVNTSHIDIVFQTE